MARREGGGDRIGHEHTVLVYTQKLAVSLTLSVVVVGPGPIEKHWPTCQWIFMRALASASVTEVASLAGSGPLVVYPLRILLPERPANSFAWEIFAILCGLRRYVLGFLQWTWGYVCFISGH